MNLIIFIVSTKSLQELQFPTVYISFSFYVRINEIVVWKVFITQVFNDIRVVLFIQTSQKHLGDCENCYQNLS